jgi:3-oxoacyl-[acyl-carrier-protein] synthase III
LLHSTTHIPTNRALHRTLVVESFLTNRRLRELSVSRPMHVDPAIAAVVQRVEEGLVFVEIETDSALTFELLLVFLEPFQDPALVDEATSHRSHYVVPIQSFLILFGDCVHLFSGIFRTVSR